MVAYEKSSPRPGLRQKVAAKLEPMRGAFFWLGAFFLVYCARPEDWIPGLKYIPMAKISGIFALVGLILSASQSKRSLRDIPKEAYYLLGIVCALTIAGALSPIWKGGALTRTADFSKLLVAWVLTYLVISNFERLRKIIFIQTSSVAVIAMVSVLKGRSHPRLEGVIGGIYSNPNDLAFAIVLSMPFCVAFMLSTKKTVSKFAWLCAMLMMFVALFLTASRGGFITFVVTATVALWHFGVRGKRPQLIAAAVLIATVVGVAAGGRLKDRFVAMSGEDLNDATDQSAYGSFEERQLLMEESFQAVLHYPWGLGMRDFANYSGRWREVHVAYLQIMAEGGIAALIFYLLYFARGFANLRKIGRMPNLDKDTILFRGALHSSLIGFIVGALFAPEAYQFFPYFAVAYTSVLLTIQNEKQGLETSTAPLNRSRLRRRFDRTGELTTVR